MVPQRQATARSVGHSFVPMEIANAATRYQAFREVEAEHLARMARHNLLEEWSPEVRAVVLTARHHVQEAGHARRSLRTYVREVVVGLKATNQPLPSVLLGIRLLLERLEESGAIRSDGGWFEAEVLEWTIQEYESAA